MKPRCVGVGLASGGTGLDVCCGPCGGVVCRSWVDLRILGVLSWRSQLKGVAFGVSAGSGVLAGGD